MAELRTRDPGVPPADDNTQSVTDQLNHAAEELAHTEVVELTIRFRNRILIDARRGAPECAATSCGRSSATVRCPGG